MNARWLLALALTGCLDPNAVEQVDLKTGGFAFHVADWYPAALFPEMPADQINVDITKLVEPQHNGAKPTDCIRVRDTTTITANGMPGVMSQAGSFDAPGDFENNCRDPFFVAKLDPRPQTIALVIDDSTAQIHIGLTLSARGYYEVTECGATACPAP